MSWEWTSIREGNPELNKPYIIKCLLEDETIGISTGWYDGKKWNDSRKEGIPLFWSNKESIVEYIPASPPSIWKRIWNKIIGKKNNDALKKL